MKMRMKLLPALLLATLVTSAPAWAGTPEPDGPTRGAAVQVRENTGGGVTVYADTITVQPNGGRVFGMNTVKDAPYIAQAVNERQQTLGDGNQIDQRRDSATWYRDGAGRTRVDVHDAKGELRTVVINDPVAGAAWTLDPRKRSALKVALQGRLPDQLRQEAAAARAATHAASEAASARDHIIVKRVERAEMPAEVRIKLPTVVMSDGTVSGDMAPLGRALASALNDAQWKKNVVTKDLGTKRFDGVKAEGKSSSYEIPAGAIGNRNPIVVSDETWYAPELQVTVYTKHSDPRSGDTVFRLENLKREEPAAALFAVPADYTVRDPLARTRTE